MCTMAEADIENADKMLLNYQYNKFILKSNGKIRNWAPIFGDPIQGVKKKFTPLGQSIEILKLLFTEPNRAKNILALPAGRLAVRHQAIRLVCK